MKQNDHGECACCGVGQSQRTAEPWTAPLLTCAQAAEARVLLALGGERLTFEHWSVHGKTAYCHCIGPIASLGFRRAADAHRVMLLCEQMRPIAADQRVPRSSWASSRFFSGKQSMGYWAHCQAEYEVLPAPSVPVPRRGGPEPWLLQARKERIPQVAITWNGITLGSGGAMVPRVVVRTGRFQCRVPVAMISKKQRAWWRRVERAIATRERQLQCS